MNEEEIKFDLISCYHHFQLKKQFIDSTIWDFTNEL